MGLKIIIPTPLRKLTQNLDVVEVEATTVKDVLDQLNARFPGFKGKVFDESGELRRFITIYVDGEDVRFLENLSTPVANAREVSIVPAIAGG
jgi:sulfur-carrier protein